MGHISNVLARCLNPVLALDTFLIRNIFFSYRVDGFCLNPVLALDTFLITLGIKGADYSILVSIQY